MYPAFIINIFKAGSNDFGLLNATSTTTKFIEKFYLFYFALNKNEFSIPANTLYCHRM